MHFLPPHKQNKEKKMSTESDLMANMLGHLDKAMAKPPICPECRGEGVVDFPEAVQAWDVPGAPIPEGPCPTCQKEADNG